MEYGDLIAESEGEMGRLYFVVVFSSFAVVGIIGSNFLFEKYAVYVGILEGAE